MEYYQFLLSPISSLSCFLFFCTPIKEIEFFSRGIYFLAMTQPSRIHSHMFIARNINTIVFIPLFISIFCYVFSQDINVVLRCLKYLFLI